MNKYSGKQRVSTTILYTHNSFESAPALFVFLVVVVVDTATP